MNSKLLRKAIKAGDKETAVSMLKKAGDFEVHLKKGWTPLHVAVKEGRAEVVTALLDAGADVNPLSDMLRTPLDLAHQFERDRIEHVLQKRGGKRGAELSLHGASMAGDITWTRKHVRNGADVNALSAGALPICLALERRHWAVARYILKKCDVRKEQRWRLTPLHVAAAAGAHEQLLNEMLKRGALLEVTNDSGETPLCCAAEAGHAHVVDFFLDHGANVSFGHERGMNPVYAALRRHHYDIGAQLIDRGSKCTLHQAIQCGHLARAREKLNGGADPNQDEDEVCLNTPIATAIWDDAVEMAELLLEYGADPNNQEPVFHSRRGVGGGDTPLHHAVNKGSAKMVKVLLAHGADPDIPDCDGLSPIERAKLRERNHLVNLMEAHLDKKLSVKAAEVGVDQLYTISKVAELLSVDTAFVTELIKTRKITCLSLDKDTLRIPAGSVQRYLAKLVR